MKKKWTVFSLVVLLFQYFSPLAVFAETMLETKGQTQLSELIITNSNSVDPENVEVTIKGKAEVANQQQATLVLGGVVSESPSSGNILDEAQQVVGTYQGHGQNVDISLTSLTKGNFKLTLRGILANKEAVSQSVSVSALGQSLTVPIELIAPTIAASTTETTVASTETTETTELSGTSETTETTGTSESTSSSEVKEPTTTSSFQVDKVPSKVQAKRGPIDIQTLFDSNSNGPKNLFTEALLTGKDGNPVDNTSIEIGDLLRLQMNFVIPENIRAQMQTGDFYKAQLPSEIKLDRNFNVDLKDANGVVYGKLVIGKDGSITITFTDAVETMSNIEGEIHVEGELAQGALEGTGPGEIEFPFVEGNEGVPIIVRPKTDDSIRKEGHLDRPTNPNEISWTVDVNVGMDKLTNAKVTEVFPQGTTYKPIVKVMTVKVDFAGVVIPKSEEVADTNTYTVDSNGNVQFIGEINSAYRLEYVTTINQGEKPGAIGGNIDYKNTATISSSELPNPIGTEATVTGTYKKMLDKLAPEYDSNTQEFKWTVAYNHTEFKIPAGSASLKDDFKGKMILKDGSVVLNKVTFDSSGNPTEGAALVPNIDYTLVPNPNGDGFVVEFTKGLDYAVNLHYVTKINEEVTGNQTYENTIIDGQGNTGGSTGEAHQQGLIKNMIDVNYSLKTFEWEIKVNQNHYELVNWTMEDTMSPGLSLPLGDRSFQLTDVTTGSPLEKGTDYTFSYDKAGGKIAIALIGNYAKTNHQFVIHYLTKFDTAILNQAGLEEFTNDVNSKWTTTDGTELGSEDHESFKPKPEEGSDGFKHGKYNAITKRITWTLGVNYNKQPLGDVTITDPITSNQKFVTGTAKIYSYTISKDGSVVKGPEIPTSTLGKYSITEPTAQKNELVVNAKDIGANDQFMVVFETSLEGEVVNAGKEYENTATVHATNVDGDFIILGKVSVANGGSIIKKDGQQDDNGFLNWSASVNLSQSTIYDAVITDHPSTNQSVDESSIILYETTVTAAGKVTKSKALDKSKYTVSLTTDSITGQQELIVKFLEEKINQPYILEYRSMLMLEKPTGEIASNKIQLTGTNKETIDEVFVGKEEVHVSDGGGTAIGVSGSLTLKKVDEKGNALTGASFELWDKSNKQVLRNGDVGSDGTLLFGKLPYGDYYLKETKIPVGHTVPNDLIAGRKVTITKETSTAGHLISIINKLSSVVLEKTDTAGKKLEGATFKLEVLVNGTWSVVPTEALLVTDTKGQLVVKGLTAGKYRFTETKAPTKPKEFVLDPTPIEFTVTTLANGQTPEVKVGPVINHLGSASFIKKDGNELTKTLEGAKFTIKRIKDASGNPVSEVSGMTYTSDANGKVTMNNLSPGEYEVTEIQAPTGYLINTNKLKFSIASITNGKPVEVIAGDFLDYQGSVSFIKKAAKEDGTAGSPLEGAEFEVLDSSGAVVKRVITRADGKVKVDKLGPGNYTLKETKTATGYILNTETVPFTIGEKAEGEPTAVELKDFLNYQGSMRLKKINTSGEGLVGAEFTLYEASDSTNTNPLEKITSDQLGRMILNGLAPGSYKLIETVAPALSESEDYIKNEYPVFFDIAATHEGKVEVVNLGDFQNFKGKAVISKMDSDGNPLAGAEFDLYVLQDNQEAFQKSITTDPDGSMPDLDNLGEGFYKLVETKAPDGFVLNENPIYITVEDSGTENPVSDKFIYNNFKATIKFKKTDSQKQLLVGAEFDLFKVAEDGTKEKVNDKPITSTDGNFIYEGLGQGNYLLKETKVPDGFIKNTKEIPFELTSFMGSETVLELPDFVNYKGSIEFLKTDKFGKTLAGAEFDLLDGKGEPVKAENGKVISAISDKNGKVSLTNLAVGKYSLKETKAPTDFILNETLLPFEITSEAEGKPKVVSLADFINYKGAISFAKKDQHGTVLAEAEFALYDDKGNVVLDGFGEPIVATSDAKGKVLVDNLKPGSYVLIETKSPTGFIKNLDPIKFEILDSNDGNPGVETFSDFVNYKGAISFVKKDAAGVSLAGAEFTLHDSNGEVVTDETGKTVVALSDSTGKVVLFDLAVGNYILKETKSPTGYILNTTEIPFTVKAEEAGTESSKPIEFADFINYLGSVELIKKDQDGALLADAEFALLDSEGQPILGHDGTAVTATSGKDGRVIFSNLKVGTYQLVETSAPIGNVINTTPIAFEISEKETGKPEVNKLGDFINYKGAVEFVKTDVEGKSLAGAEFALLDKEGKPVTSIVGQPITATSGTDGSVRFDHISVGSYLIRETKAPTGYIINQTDIPFTIDKEHTGEVLPLDLGDFINYQGSVEFVKTDVEGTPLAGAEFALLDKEGKPVTSIVGQPITATSGTDGSVRFDHISVGSYLIRETKAPTGYIINQTDIPFTIDKEHTGEVLPLDLGDFINYQGSVEFVKTDVEGTPLAGAEFALLDKEGKPVTSIVGQPITATSGTDGSVRFDHISVGSYLIRETKAPTGYIINQTDIPFTIDKEHTGEVLPLDLGDFINYQGSVELLKVDKDNLKKTLAGAEFKLSDSTGKVIKEQVVTDSQGKVSIDKLAPGTYSLVETKAPTGYDLRKEATTFVIKDKTKGKVAVETVTITNVKTPVKNPVSESGDKDKGKNFPKAGESSSSILLTLGLSMIVASLGIYGVRKRHSYK